MRDKSNSTEENNIVGRTKSKRTDHISVHLSCLCTNEKSMRSYLAGLEVLKQDENYDSTRRETWWEYSHGQNIEELIQLGKEMEEVFLSGRM